MPRSPGIVLAARLTLTLAAGGAIALAGSGCRRGGTHASAGAAHTPTPRPTVKVPEGYHGMSWGTPRARVEQSDPGLAPSKKDPKILVRDSSANGMTGTEAFFFDANGGLEEVELRFSPKRTPKESAELGLTMDESMGPHEVAAADDNGYQFVWQGTGTEVRLAYDLRDSVPWGPVISWAPASLSSATAPTGGSPASTPGTPSVSGNPGPCFVSAIRTARSAGMHLNAVEGGRGRLTLVYETSGTAKEIALTADPKTGKLLGCATLPRAASSAPLQFRAETALDEEVAHTEPVALKFGGPAALRDVITVQFKDGSWLSLQPGAGDALVARSGNTPK